MSLPASSYISLSQRLSLADLSRHRISRGGLGSSSAVVCCLDFTCTTAIQAALVKGCAVDGAHAAEHAHQLKVWKYSARCEREGLAFIPLAVDSFGRWHPKALEVITTLGRQLARNVGREGGESVRHLRQRLGVMLVRDSVAILCARTPTFAPPEVYGDLNRDEPRGA